MTTFHAGHRVSVTALGETPLDAIAKHLVLEPQPAPDPSTLRAHDVIVAVRSTQVGWVDLLMTSGQYQHLVTPPFTPGMETCGEVVWVGADVRRWKVGDRVIVDGLESGPRSLGDYQRWGGFATYAVAPEHALIALPEALSFDEGAALLAGYETAYHALVHRGRLTSGETVLVHGSTGTTGLAAVQLAKRIGATVIATGRSLDKLALVQEAGADHVIATSAETSLREAVKALTGGRGVDVVYDPVGGALSVESLRCVTFGARYLIVGWAATPFVAQGQGQRGAPNANVLPTNLILMKSLDVLGCPAAISAHKDPSIRPARLEAVLRYVREGLRPRIAKTYPLTDIVAALHAKWESREVGAIVVHP